MIELLYPQNPAPMEPSLRASSVGKKESCTEECLPIVDEAGIVVARGLRSYVHSGAKPLHPVVHLHIMDRSQRIYLQKRSATKKLLPGYWDTAVGGHIGYGESITEALFRETGEEAGLTDFNPIFLTSYIHESQIEKELVSVFAAIGSFELKPDPGEVECGKWWTLEEIEHALGKDILTPNFESEIKRIEESLLALL